MKMMDFHETDFPGRPSSHKVQCVGTREMERAGNEFIRIRNNFTIMTRSFSSGNQDCIHRLNVLTIHNKSSQPFRGVLTDLARPVLVTFSLRLLICR